MAEAQGPIMGKGGRHPAYIRAHSKRQDVTRAMEKNAQALKEGDMNFTKQLLENHRIKEQIQVQMKLKRAQEAQQITQESSQTEVLSEKSKEEMYKTNQERLRELAEIQPTSYEHAIKLSEERQRRIALEKERIAAEKQIIKEKRELRNRARKARFKFTAKGQPVMEAYIANLLKQIEKGK